MSQPDPHRLAQYGELYRLLVASFPRHRSQQNVFDIPCFAKDLGYAHETLYKAVRQRSLLRIKVAHQIIKFSHTNQDATPLYWSDLEKFVLPDFLQFAKPTDIDDLLG